MYKHTLLNSCMLDPIATIMKISLFTVMINSKANKNNLQDGKDTMGITIPVKIIVS